MPDEGEIFRADLFSEQLTQGQREMSSELRVVRLTSF